MKHIWLDRAKNLLCDGQKGPQMASMGREATTIFVGYAGWILDQILARFVTRKLRLCMRSGEQGLVEFQTAVQGVLVHRHAR